jgi:hypothetical protein
MRDDMRFGVFYTPPPKVPRGRWMIDGDQDGDRWEGTSAQAEEEAEQLKKRHPGATVEVRPITD